MTGPDPDSLVTDGVRLLDDGAAIEIVLDGRPVRFHAIWLRDNAQDSATRDPGSGQRLITLNDIPAGIRVIAAAWAGDRLHLRFAPEAHDTTFSAAWLRAHAYDGRSRADTGWTGPDIVRWDGAGAGELPVFDFAEVSVDERRRLAWLKAIRRHGFARLRGVPIEDGAPLKIVALFGHVRETNYGRAFDVRTEARPTNLAYTDLALQAHTDNPYRDPVPGLQVLACLRNEAQGGTSILVDGFAAVARLRELCPHGFDLLARSPARFAYSGSDGVRLAAKRPMIELGPDGELRAIRFNNRSAAPLVDVPYDDMPAYYRACRRFAELIETPALALRFRLDPGEAVVFDNERVLHARSEIIGTGARHLQGCYADKDGLHSRIAVLQERVSRAC